MIAKLHLYLLDVAAALVIAFLCGYAMLERQDPPLWQVVPLALAIGLPVAVRRWYPLTTMTVASAATAAAVLTTAIPVEAIGAPLASLCVCLYSVAVERPRTHSLLAGAASVVLIGLLGSLTEVAQLSLALAVAWVIGYTTRVRRSFVTREAEQQAAQALTDERLRIARELHDIVAHNLSLIAVKASTAAHVRSPDEAFDALAVISDTSRTALAEMRHLLGVLRSDASLAPAPGLAALPDLVDRAAMAGVTVSLDVRGSLDVPPGVSLSAYRIVQESVTNVVKHATPASCAVSVEITDALVRIDVTDDGPGSLAPMGHGLLGMRERVAVYDGTFSAGPLAAGGFQVRAELPYR
ncbi:sensor histidine kinase [Lentzea tibetensis]|nr:sensor histidine kinase [Lentzea tibetensis]